MPKAGKEQAVEDGATSGSPPPALRPSSQQESTTTTSKQSEKQAGELALSGAYRDEEDRQSDAGDDEIANLASSNAAEQPKSDNDPAMDNDPEQPAPTPVTAVKVEDGGEEAVAEARKKLLQEAVHADVVERSTKRNKWVGLVLIALAIIALVVGLSVGLTRDDGDSDTEVSQSDASNGVPTSPNVLVSPAPTPSPPVDRQQPTLERVQERGSVVCGIQSRFWAENESEDDFEGLPIDLCRAIAVAAFGEHEGRVEYMASPNSDRWNLIDNRTIDVTMNFDTHTMDRDVYEAGTGTGFTFSAPYQYGGLSFEGESRLIECVDRYDSLTDDCRDLTICIRPSTTEQAVIEELIPGAQFYEVNWDANMREPFLDGECNVIGTSVGFTGEEQLREDGFVGNYSAGGSVLTRDPLAMFTRKDDAEWSDLVNWVLQALLAAEARNITNVSTFVPASLPFGENHVLNFTAILEVGGNFGHFSLQDLAVGGLNAINVDGSTGLLYSFPLGKTDTVGSVSGGTLGAVLERGHLRCGVSEQPGFAEFNATTGDWKGFDVEFCRAIHAALYRDESEVELVSYAVDDRFIGLANSEVDILAGGPASYEVDTFEPTSGVGFQLSQPYFYGEVNIDAGTGDVRVLLTREDDQQFSDFVYWILNALVLAEEQGIGQKSAVKMPVTDVFGEPLKQMFRDAVFATGNYGEIYNRTLETTIARGGRNLLNSNPVGPQKFPLPFFSSSQ